MRKIKLGAFSFDDRVWQSVSQAAKDFVTALLTHDKNVRPSAAEALKHPWITEHAQL